MLGHIKLSFAVVAGAGLVSALSISQSCQGSLTALLASPDAACLNPSAFLPLIIGASTSVPDTINTWVGGICSSGSCTNETLSAVITNVTSGCSDELSSFGVTASTVQEVISVVQQAYPTVRQAACLKNDTTNALCISETLTNVENLVGQLQITDFSFLDIVSDIKNLIQTGVQSVACTSCVKAAYTTVRTSFPDLVNAVTPEIQQFCGTSFVDGASPDGITQTAVNGVFTEESSDSKSSDALNLTPFSGMAGFALFIVSTVFMTL